MDAKNLEVAIKNFDKIQTGKTSILISGERPFDNYANSFIPLLPQLDTGEGNKV